MISLCVVKTEPHKYIITTTDCRYKFDKMTAEALWAESEKDFAAIRSRVIPGFLGQAVGGLVGSLLFRKPDPINHFTKHSSNSPNEGWTEV